MHNKLLITGGTGSFGNAVLRRFLDSNIEEIRAQRKMKLPFHAESEGKFKLPFVVRADVAGTQILKINLFDGNSKLIKERSLKIKFAKQQ